MQRKNELIHLWLVRFEDGVMWCAGQGTEEEIRKKAEEKSKKEGHGEIKFLG